MYKSQEMPNLRRFLARFLLCDNNIEKLDFGDSFIRISPNFFIPKACLYH